MLLAIVGGVGTALVLAPFRRTNLCPPFLNGEPLFGPGRVPDPTVCYLWSSILVDYDGRTLAENIGIAITAGLAAALAVYAIVRSLSH